MSKQKPYRISVAIATPLPMSLGVELDYLCEEPLERGAVVIVPLGSREVVGVVMGEGSGDVSAKKLKFIIKVADFPLISKVQLDWLDNVSAWTLANPGAVLKMMLPSQAMFKPRRTRKTKTKEKSSHPKKRDFTLNAEQKKAASTLTKAIKTGGYKTFLLDGVTGAGKTEVYFEAVAETLKSGKQALILLPEIALTPALKAQFESRFGEAPLEWHSGLSDAARYRTYHAIAKSDTPNKVLVGARSALFLPYANLGLIVVDEEHDASYKQEDQVVYHARNMAVMRAKAENIPAVLVSATPSLESEVNVDRGKYQRLTLTSRISSASMPIIELVDIAKAPPKTGSWIAEPLAEAIQDRLSKKQQVLLFLNRRGYAPVMICHACGEKVACPNCSAWLVVHKSSPMLHCHHCGHTDYALETCPSCEETGKMAAYGPGVERLSEEIKKRFPHAKQSILSSDTTRNPETLAAMLDDIERGAIDIIIGTQMVAKGHHFPHLTLVGVIDADLGLAGGDLRAAEHTWQLLVQVAGRAGRSAEYQGTAMLQTALPNTPILRSIAEGDRDGFLKCEKTARETAGMPPYGKLASILISHGDAKSLNEFAARFAQAKPRYEGVTILGPAPPAIAYLRKRHRLRFIIRTPNEVNIQSIIKEWLTPMRQNPNPLKPPHDLRLQVDIDPYQFM